MSNESSQIIKTDPEKVEPFLEDSHDGSEEWQDVLGTGGIMRKILVEGKDNDDSEVLNMQHRFVSVIDIETRFVGSEKAIPKESHVDYTVSTDADIFPAVNLAIPLMNVGETSQFIFEPRFTYGATGNLPDIPPETKLDCLITIKQKYSHDDYVQEILPALDLNERLLQANRKKERGNFWHSRQEYMNAIDAYNSAVSYLEDALSEQELIEYAKVTSDTDNQIKVEAARCLVACKNNLAATYIKTNSLKTALQNVDRALEIQPNNVKALFRKANIQEMLHDYEDATNTLTQLLLLDSNNKAAIDRLNVIIKKQKEASKKIREMCKRMFDPDSTGSKKTLSNIPNGSTTDQLHKKSNGMITSSWSSSAMAKFGVVGAAVVAVVMAVIYTSYVSN